LWNFIPSNNFNLDRIYRLALVRQNERLFLDHIKWILVLNNRSYSNQVWARDKHDIIFLFAEEKLKSVFGFSIILWLSPLHFKL